MRKFIPAPLSFRLPHRANQFRTIPVSQQNPAPGSEIILYQTEDGRTRLQVKLENSTVWLSQAQMAELFQKDVRTINEHLVNIYDEGELPREATIRNFRIVRSEGKREVSREIEHYSLEAILAVGYRVRSHRGTQFRQWATARLSEYLVKGFTMDDERLKNPPAQGQTDYFDELLERIRDIRSSERRFYQKILDIYATSVDYAPDAERCTVLGGSGRAATAPPTSEAQGRRNCLETPRFGHAPGARCAGRQSRSATLSTSQSRPRWRAQGQCQDTSDVGWLTRISLPFTLILP